MGDVTTLAEALPIAMRAARAQARAAVLRGGVAPADFEDLVQEGRTAVLQALPKFDPTRASLPTFIELVVGSRLASLARTRRRRPQLVQLRKSDDLVDMGSGGEVELRADIQRVLDTLPRSDRRVALGLMDNSPTEVGRLLHISHSAVYRAIGRIRAAFIQAGLQPEGAPERNAA